MKTFIILAALVAVAIAKSATFDDFRVWRVTPTNEDDLEALRALQDNSETYDFWTSVSVVNKPVDIMVAPHQEPEFIESINKSSLHFELFIEDVQKLINKEQPRTRGSGVVDFKRYNNLDEIYNWLEKLAEKYDEVKVVEGGQTYEGRKILGVHVSFDKSNEKNAVFLEGGIHAREWISSAVVMFQLNEILTSTDPEVRAMAESHDWYIFPVVNPDGFEYTHTKNRMWRKTRQPYGFCYGADPNRNWGYKWNQGGASSNPCLDTYAGSHAFSEIETKSLSEYITSIAHNLVAYIGHHSYSQFLLVPYGDSNAHRDNYDELISIGKKGLKSLAKRYGTEFEVGNIVDLVYIATGSSMDWVKATHGVRLTYTYELRDTGRYGFALPADQIIPSGLEVLDALVTILSQ